MSFNFSVIFFFWLIFWFSFPGFSLSGSLQRCVLTLITFGGKCISMPWGVLEKLCRMCIRIVQPRKGKGEYLAHQLSIFHWSRATPRKFIFSHLLIVYVWVLAGALPSIPQSRVRETLRQKELCGAVSPAWRLLLHIAGLKGRLRECEVGGCKNMLPEALPGSSQAAPTRAPAWTFLPSQ